MPESGELNQTQLEQAIKSESQQQAGSLQALEQEKIVGDEQSTQNLTHLSTPIIYDEDIPDPERQTKDFIEKHGSLIRRREKRHTGRGLGSKHDIKKLRQLKQESLLHKFALGETLSQGVVDYEEGYLESIPFGIDEIKKEYGDLFDTLDSARPRNPNLIEQYSHTENKIDRLKLLSRMHIVDATLAVLSSEEPGKEYLLKKLKFYKDLQEGRATRKTLEYQKYDEWNYQKNTYIEVEKFIPVEETSPENIATGLLRNVLYAEMKGTPELAAFNIAMRRAIEQSGYIDQYRRQRSTAHMPALFGYHSGIFYGQEGIGHYETLVDIYSEALAVASKDNNVESYPQVIEHKAVMLAAKWYTKAMEYNNPIRSQHSPYSSLERGVDQGVKESIAWARLGESVQRQLRGMRQKINGVDLHHIDRFIGKSGDDKYGRESRKIHWELKQVPYYAGEREEWALKRNVHDIARINKQHRKKQEAIMLRLERKKIDIASLELPEEERALQLQSVTARYEDELRKIDEVYETESQRLRSRTPEQLIEELQAKEKALKAKHERHKSLAEKAVSLHFACEQKDENGNFVSTPLNVIDWINDADFGVINWAHNALQRGVSQETVGAYVAARSAFPQLPITRDLLEVMKKSQPTAELIGKLRLVSNTMQKHTITFTPEEAIALTVYDSSVLSQRLEQGYTKDALLQYSWLNDQSLPTQERFPFDKNPGAQEAWCAKYAFYVPEGWRRKGFGGMILNRLQKRIDPTIHDATYWLSEFELPDQRGEVIYRDKAREQALLYTITSVPQEMQFRVPTNQNKYADLFSSPANVALYKAMLPVFTSGSISQEQFKRIVSELLAEAEFQPEQVIQKGISPATFKSELEATSQAIIHMYEEGREREKIPTIIADLRTISSERKQAIDEAYTWFRTNSDTPHTLLTFAWRNRADALVDGCEDNPRAIKQWADLNGIRAAYNSMESSGELPANFSREDLKTMDKWASELIRCYDGKRVIKELAYIKERLNKDYLITPQRVVLGDGWHGEIFQKDDPRGMTIGVDTGCCMTLDGVSKSCINAGYTKPPYGFLALYRDGKIVAQSFLYTNPDQDTKTLVCDNIEANQGRDMIQVVQRYRQFFGKYFQDQLRRGYGTQFTNVNVGTGFTDVGLDDCPPTSTVPMPNPGIYTDASSQRLLYAMPLEIAQQCKEYTSEIYNHDPLAWDTIRNEIMTLTQAAFPDAKQQNETQMQAAFTNTDGITVVMRKGGKIIGYCTTSPTEYGNEKALHVSSTAILPQFQRGGLISDLMYTLEVEAQKRGFTVMTTHAPVTNSYADKLEKHYEILEKKDIKGEFGPRRFLVMRIPVHPQSTLLEKRPTENKTRRVVVTPLSANDVELITHMEEQCYPPDLIQGDEFFEEAFAQEARVRQEVGRDDLQFSFLAKKGESPAGYIIASPQQSEVKNGEMVAHIDDLAVLPQFRGSEVARELLSNVIDMITAYKQQADQFGESAIKFNGAIEMEAREKTSYRLLMNPRIQTWLQTKGYHITDTKKLPEYLGNEDFYFVRLERV